MAARPAKEAPTASFVLSLFAGILILVGGGMTALFGGFFFGMMDGYNGASGGYYGMMQGFGTGEWTYGLAVIGLISGVVVLVGAVMIYSRPGSASTWGLVVLVFSILSFFGMGMAFLGAILGVLGGVLAMTWRPVEAPK